MKLEKKTAVLYVRVKPSVKAWVLKRMKKEGWENLSDFMCELLEKLKSNDSKKRPAKRSNKKAK